MEMQLATVLPVPADAMSSAEFDVPAAVVKSAGRALRILEFFDLVQREANVCEISSSLKYPQSSTSVLVRSLVAMGYLQHNRIKRTYFPTRRVSLLGSWLDPSVVQHGALVELAHAISRETGETAVMATINGLNAQYIFIQRHASDSGTQSAFTLGAMRSLGRTAVGAALLSRFDDLHVAKLLRRINAEKKPYEPLIDISRYITELASGRRSGLFTGAGAVAGTIGISAPIDCNRNGESLVVAIEGPEERFLDQTAFLSQQMKSALVGFDPRTNGPQPNPVS